MSRFVKFAWFNVGYTIFVILWGALVRATGSGAGCGNHWPTCNGEIIPRPEQIETLIEFSHRVTSAIAGLFVLILLIWAFRITMQHRQRFVRSMAVLSFIFILIEGGIGAALVRLELVADNDSTLRAVMIAIHLANTLVLLGFQTLVAWGAQRDTPLKLEQRKLLVGGMLIGLFGYMLVGAAGAITALGDTLFPAASLAEGLAQKFDPAAHFLVRLRIWHPIIAVVVTVYLYGFGWYILRRYDSPQIERLMNWLFIGLAMQIGLGMINIVLLAPVWMQLVHLFVADAIWILLVVMTASLVSQPQLAEKPKRIGDDAPALAAGD